MHTFLMLSQQDRVSVITPYFQQQQQKWKPKSSVLKQV